MATVSIARRYARALLDALADHAQLDRAAEQLEALATALRDNPDLAQIFADPSFSRAQRSGVVDGLLQQLQQPPKELNGLVRLLVERDRLLLLPDIARLFRDLADARVGRVRGEVTSAVPLTTETMQRLEQALERATQRDVVLKAKVAPELIGGVSARVGSLVFDGSLSTQLETLRKQLLA
jgi:F-type H+-transporting ATPase subunit delta